VSIAVHVCAPRPTTHSLIRFNCPTCGRRRFGVSFFYEWYGFDLTCLRCGERWADGEMMPRPFAPHWRAKSIERAKEMYRRAARTQEGETP